MIKKFPLAHGSDNQLPVGVGARFLHFAMQFGMPTAWYDCPNDMLGSVSVRVFATGDTPPPNLGVRHLGTCLEGDGYFVWHLFEVGSTNVGFTSVPYTQG